VIRRDRAIKTKEGSPQLDPRRESFPAQDDVAHQEDEAEDIKHARASYTTIDDIPLISLGEMKRSRPLGRGRNVAMCLVLWRGQQVTIKQFDISKAGRRHYEDELAAYYYLYGAWGRLVPTPKFRCECFPRSYLSMRLGRMPDKKCRCGPLSYALCDPTTAFIICVDEHEGNMLLIPNEDGWRD
jgi:hypothetical protein